MANTYTQLYIQIVFAVKGRQSLIPNSHKEEVHKYITGIVQKRKHKMLEVHCMPDHAHVFVGLHPTQSISNLARDIKTASSTFIKAQEWMKYNFSWQSGYGAFSYHRSLIDKVCRYIKNQEEHHRQVSFREEYLKFLEEFDISFDDRYLFDWIGN